jgi:hypothetical protein
MTRTVIVSVATNSTQVPVGPAPAGIVITLIGAAGLSAVAPQTIVAAPYAATFENVEAGAYTATAQTIDINGNPIGAPATSSIYDVVDTVPVPPTTMAVDIPVSISIAAQ